MSLPSTSPNKWLVTLSVSFGTLMGALDITIVNIAMPRIRGAIGATPEEITWVSTGFIIATVMMMPLPGFLGRLFGLKRAYLACLALFVVSSFLCGIAWSLSSLVAFRVLQGLGAGALFPIEQAILRQTFPPEEQGMAMAAFTWIVTVGPAFAPTLGGYIVDNFHWSWIFFINLPIGAIGFLMVSSFVEEPEDVRAANQAAARFERHNIDFTGIALLCVGLASFQYIVAEGQRHDWFESSWITGVALLSALSLTAFVLHELTTAAPAVHLRLFKDIKFACGSLLAGLMFFVFVASMFLLSLYMQEVLGFDAIDAGLALLPRTMVMVIAIPILGRLYNRLPLRPLIVLGLLISGWGVYQMSLFTLESSSRDIMLALALQGLGTSLLFVPLNTVALEDVPRHQMADGTGLNSLMRQIGASLGLAVFAGLLTRYTMQAQVALSTHVVAGRPEVMERLALAQGGLGPSLGGAVDEASLRVIAATVERQATMLAFDRLFALAALMFLAVLPLLYFLRAGARVQPAAHVTTESSATAEAAR